MLNADFSISEISNEKVNNLEQIISIGDELDVKIIKMEPEARKIGLSRKGIEKAAEEGVNNQEAQSNLKVSDNTCEEDVNDLKKENK